MGKLEKEFTNLFVKNIADSVSEEDLEKKFSEFGKITSRKISTDEKDDSNKSKGFGFVAFEDPEDARKAVEALNGQKIENFTKDDAELYVGRAQKKAERQQTLKASYEKRRQENQSKFKGVNLYVKNLDDTITDEKLREAFESFGTITSAKVMHDDKAGNKGFGFVCFTSQEEATKAVTEMNGKILVSKPLYVALAQRKDERKQHLAMQHNQRLNNLRLQAGMYQQPMQQQMYMQQVMQQPTQRGPYYPPAGVRGAYMQPQNGQRMVMQQGQAFRQMQGMQGQHPRNTRNQPRQPGRVKPNYPNQNQPRQQRPPNQIPMPPPNALQTPGQEPLTASALASATNEQQKQMLGERLFPLIQGTHPELAGKITGMLLEMDNSELLHLLEDNNALKSKVEEAVKVLDEHQRSQQGQGPGTVA
jgi:polyadenylate-binding protein